MNLEENLQIKLIKLFLSDSRVQVVSEMNLRGSNMPRTDAFPMNFKLMVFYRKPLKESGEVPLPAIIMIFYKLQQLFPSLQVDEPGWLTVN
jgi:hypothetical protein